MRSKGPRYTPVSKRADKPDAIAFLLKTFPDLQDAQVAKLVGTTKDTITKVRDRTHWNASHIKPQNPVLLGICKQADLDAAVARAERRVARERKKAGIVDLPHSAESHDTFSPITHDSLGGDQPDIDPESMFRSMG